MEYLKKQLGLICVGELKLSFKVKHIRKWERQSTTVKPA